MAGNLSQATLVAIIDAYLSKSDLIHHATDGGAGKFDLSVVAHRAWTHKTANATLSRIRSGTKRCRSEDAEAILQACSALLQEQCELAAHFLKQFSAAELEASICRDLGLVGDRPAVGHLGDVDSIIEAKTAADIGFDDLSLWNASMPWQGAHRPLARARSLEILPMLLNAASLASTDERRMQVARIAVALAMHHQPGTVDHDRAYDLANDVLAKARVYTLSDSKLADEALRAEALNIRMHLLWCRVAPHREATTNYLNYLLADKPMPSEVLDDLSNALDDIFRLNSMRRQLQAGIERATTDSASAVSVLGRLILVTGGSLIDADARSAESERYSTKSFHASTHVNAVVRGLARGKLDEASKACEAAIQACGEHEKFAAQRAYAALLVQIAARRGWTTIEDKSIVAMAREACESEQITFLYSHIFNAAATRRLLEQGSSKPTQPRRSS